LPIRIFVIAALLSAALPLSAPAQSPTPEHPAVIDGNLDTRPLPHPIVAPPNFAQAVALGTRSDTGHPGADYWQQRVDYTIEAELNPADNILIGSVSIDYQNNSPDELPMLILKLRQNLHLPNAQRNRDVPITSGISVSNVVAADTRIRQSTQLYAATYIIGGTVMAIGLPEPLQPGASTTVSMDFSFTVPPVGAPRMGQDGEVWYLGYWYPQMAVYDDIRAWHTDPYLGLGEHYMGYGDYEVRITVPGGWLVAATGELQNAEGVLAPAVIERLETVLETDEVVHVVTANELGRATLPGPSRTWHFRAENVRDFAFGTSDRYVWDATRAAVGDHTDDGRTDFSLIHALYRPGTASWERAAEFTRFSIEHLSETLFPFPYPHMTAVEGIIPGGMEYPMITLIGGDRNDRSLFSVTYHEIAHMWYPMIVGQDEKSFMWMDEGLVSYLTNIGFEAFWGDNRWPRESHYQIAGTGVAEPPMLHNDQFSTTFPRARVVASYSTPALMLRALEGVVGTEAFYEAFNEYGRRWAYKHPYPWDLFNTFEDVLGKNLDWLWYPMLFNTWTMDHALTGLDATPNGWSVTIEDRGLAPMPVYVVGTYADGGSEQVTVPVDVWLEGHTSTTAVLPPGDLVRVELDPEGWFPDVDRSSTVLEVGDLQLSQ